MRRLLLPILVVVVITAGCSDEPETLEDVTEAVYTAVQAGDNEAWRSLHDPDATVTFPDGETIAMFGAVDWISDDFDRDGVTSFADQLQSSSALHEPAGQSMSWECSQIDATTMECVVEATDSFIERAGAQPMVSAARLTVIDGRVVAQEFLDPPDAAAFDATVAAYDREMAEYERWVDATHHHSYAAAFHGPCCGSPMVRTPDGISQHNELMAQYFSN